MFQGVESVRNIVELYITLTRRKMKSVNRKICPCCGQTINDREVTLYSGMVKALVRVYYWCLENDKHEFTRKEIKPIFKGVDNEIARWGDWILFGNGMVYKPDGKGSWGLNMERVREFVEGKREIPTRVVIRRLDGENEYLDYKNIGCIPNLGNFLDEAGQYISKYIN